MSNEKKTRAVSGNAVDTVVDAIRKLMADIGDDVQTKEKLQKALSGIIEEEKPEHLPDEDVADSDEVDDTDEEIEEEEIDDDTDDDTDDDDDDDDDELATALAGVVIGAVLVGGGVLLHKLLTRD